jgi:subtilase family serine protease
MLCRSIRPMMQPAWRSPHVPSVVAVIRAVAIAVATLSAASTSVLGAELDDLGAMVAEPPAWVLDHSSGTGVRVTHQMPGSRRAVLSPDAGQFATSGPAGYSPKQVRHAYRFDKLKNDGRGQIIGIPNAFDYPNAAADLKNFIKTFGLKKMYGLPGKAPCTVAAGPHPCFEVVYARGTPPPFDESWALESAMDIEWAHAIAPGADVLLVEASSNNFLDLFQAVLVATGQGVTVVSMSWGSAGESAILSFFDPLLDVPGVTFVAASGDLGNGLSYPSTSPFVVGVGGTTLHLDKKGKRKGSETAWSGSGGGISQFVAEPGYQLAYPIPPTGGFRGAPDVAYDADPATGFSIYTSHGFAGQTGWLVAAGTSAGSPQWAALFALANEKRDAGNLSGSNPTSSPIYDVATNDYRHTFVDIKSGGNGACGPVCTAATGYDFVTGLGSPMADELIHDLAD